MLAFSFVIASGFFSVIEAAFAFGGGSSKPKPEPVVSFDPIDRHKGYNLLSQLAQRGSKVEIRGLGKCMGRVFFFFNKPYLYLGDQEIVFNAVTRSFMVLYLKPESVRGYSKNKRLLNWVCGGRETCETLMDDVYISVYEQDSKCIAYVVDSQFELTKYKRTYPTFDMFNNMQFLKFLDYKGFQGIPYSKCGPSLPSIRFAVFGEFKLAKRDCRLKKFIEYYQTKRKCTDELQRMSNIDKGMRLLLTADGIQTREDMFTTMIQLKLFRRNVYRFGTCIDNRYAFVKPDNVLVFKDHLNNRETYDMMSFTYLTFDSVETLQNLEIFFNVYVAPPDGATSGPKQPPLRQVPITGTLESGETAGTTNGIVSAVIVSVYTDQPPPYTDDEFTGMPEKSVTMYVTYLLPQAFYDKTNQKYMVLVVIIIALAMVFCCICILCFCITMRHGHRSTRRPPPSRQQKQKIIVQVQPTKPSPRTRRR